MHTYICKMDACICACIIKVMFCSIINIHMLRFEKLLNFYKNIFNISHTFVYYKTDDFVITLQYAYTLFYLNCYWAFMLY